MASELGTALVIGGSLVVSDFLFLVLAGYSQNRG
jgi:hypothetical protein